MLPSTSCPIKICGITRREDAVYACELGAWALGFIFAEKSPRTVTTQNARNIIDHIRQLGLTPPLLVGVFVNPTREQVLEAVQISGINTVQLHGDETPSFCKSIGMPTIKALRLNSKEQLPYAGSYAGIVDYMLIDACHPSAYGGSGRLADWSLALALKDCGRLILAGGINPDNIDEAIRSVAPYAIDLSSGVEEAPGIKSHSLLARLFSQAG